MGAQREDRVSGASRNRESEKPLHQSLTVGKTKGSRARQEALRDPTRSYYVVGVVSATLLFLRRPVSAA